MTKNNYSNGDPRIAALIQESKSVVEESKVPSDDVKKIYAKIGELEKIDPDHDDLASLEMQLNDLGYKLDQAGNLLEENIATDLAAVKEKIAATKERLATVDSELDEVNSELDGLDGDSDVDVDLDDDETDEDIDLDLDDDDDDTDPDGGEDIPEGDDEDSDDDIDIDVEDDDDEDEEIEVEDDEDEEIEVEDDEDEEIEVEDDEDLDEQSKHATINGDAYDLKEEGTTSTTDTTQVGFDIDLDAQAPKADDSLSDALIEVTENIGSQAIDFIAALRDAGFTIDFFAEDDDDISDEAYDGLVSLFNSASVDQLKKIDLADILDGMISDDYFDADTTAVLSKVYVDAPAEDAPAESEIKTDDDYWKAGIDDSITLEPKLNAIWMLSNALSDVDVVDLMEVLNKNYTVIDEDGTDGEDRVIAKSDLAYFEQIAEDRDSDSPKYKLTIKQWLKGFAKDSNLLDMWDEIADDQWGGGAVTVQEFIKESTRYQTADPKIAKLSEEDSKGIADTQQINFDVDLSAEQPAKKSSKLKEDLKQLLMDSAGGDWDDFISEIHDYDMVSGNFDNIEYDGGEVSEDLMDTIFEIIDITDEEKLLEIPFVQANFDDETEKEEPTEDLKETLSQYFQNSNDNDLRKLVKAFNATNNEDYDFADVLANENDELLGIYDIIDDDMSDVQLKEVIAAYKADDSEMPEASPFEWDFYQGSLDDAGITSEEAADEVKDFLDIDTTKEGSWLQGGSRLDAEYTTTSGKKVVIKQDGEFNMFGGPYSPEMQKPEVTMDGKDMIDTIVESFRGFHGDPNELQAEIDAGTWDFICMIRYDVYAGDLN
jgi:hypothetical protein